LTDVTLNKGDPNTTVCNAIKSSKRYVGRLAFAKTRRMIRVKSSVPACPRV
jgi:hypothetical protein